LELCLLLAHSHYNTIWTVKGSIQPCNQCEHAIQSSSVSV